MSNGVKYSYTPIVETPPTKLLPVSLVVALEAYYRTQDFEDYGVNDGDKITKAMIPFFHGYYIGRASLNDQQSLDAFIKNYTSPYEVREIIDALEKYGSIRLHVEEDE